MTLPEDLSARLDTVIHSSLVLVERFDPGPPVSGPAVVLSSAFNPPTVAHLDLLDLGREVGGMPAALLTTTNVDKGLYGASLQHRIGMLLAVCAEQPFAVLASNAARFVDQASVLRTTFAGATFDFVMGHDTLIRLFDPKYYFPGQMEAELEGFFGHHRVIATNRGAAGTEDVAGVVASLPARFQARIETRELHPHRAEVSSSAMRANVAAGAPPADLPGPVERYIAEHRLYR
ncbi:MAG: hypothetical protein WEC33_00925 [Dehalococcoidia bacterium]